MPGFVIYHTNYSMAITPDITGIQEIIYYVHFPPSKKMADFFNLINLI